MEHLRAPSPATTDRVTLGVGIHNALTALIARNAGFRLLWLGSADFVI